MLVQPVNKAPLKLEKYVIKIYSKESQLVKSHVLPAPVPPTKNDWGTRGCWKSDNDISFKLLQLLALIDDMSQFSGWSKHPAEFNINDSILVSGLKSMLNPPKAVSSQAAEVNDNGPNRWISDGLSVLICLTLLSNHTLAPLEDDPE